MALSSCLCSEHFVFAQTDQTTTSLQAAESALGQAFNSVLEAEKAGGNVSQLLVKLNLAGALLTEAQNAYTSGNTSDITSITANVIQIADQVNDTAVSLRDVSLVNSQNSFSLTLMFSVFGAAAFVIFLLFVWQRFKRSFIKKLLRSKPEVVENAT